MLHIRILSILDTFRLTRFQIFYWYLLIIWLLPIVSIYGYLAALLWIKDSLLLSRRTMNKYYLSFMAHVVVLSVRRGQLLKLWNHITGIFIVGIQWIFIDQGYGFWSSWLIFRSFSFDNLYIRTSSEWRPFFRTQWQIFIKDILLWRVLTKCGTFQTAARPKGLVDGLPLCFLDLCYEPRRLFASFSGCLFEIIFSITYLSHLSHFILPFGTREVTNCWIGWLITLMTEKNVKLGYPWTINSQFLII